MSVSYIFFINATWYNFPNDKGGFIVKKVEECIITNMVMVYDNEGNVLVQNRADINWPGITFPGGHVDRKESFVKSAIREVKEETGLDITDLRLCGVKQFTHSTRGYRYIVLYFKTNKFSGTLQSSDEGEIFWVNRKDLLSYKLAEDFEEMLKVFEDDELNENYFYFENKAWQLENL